MPVDASGLEVGYRLIPNWSTKGQDGDLLRPTSRAGASSPRRSASCRRSAISATASELVNGYHSPQGRGGRRGRGVRGHVHGDQSWRRGAACPAPRRASPAFGLPATWIGGSFPTGAVSTGHTVVDAAQWWRPIQPPHADPRGGAAGTRGNPVAGSTISSKTQPKLLDDVVPKLVPGGDLQRAADAPRRRVHIRDMRTIVETVAEHAARTPGARPGGRCASRPRHHAGYLQGGHRSRR